MVFPRGLSLSGFPKGVEVVNFVPLAPLAPLGAPYEFSRMPRFFPRGRFFDQMYQNPPVPTKIRRGPVLMNGSAGLSRGLRETCGIFRDFRDSVLGLRGCGLEAQDA